MNPKIALVTGANKGIGKEVARQLAQKGMHVILTARDAKKGQSAVKELALPNIVFHQLDVTDEKSMQTLYKFIEKTYGRLDVLISNAGVLLDFSKSSLNVPINTLRETLETNVYGPLRLAQLFIPLMNKNTYGRIVNISSEYGQLSSMEGDYCPAYKISKAALNAVTRVLAYHKDTTNLLINSVCPGWVRTDMGGANAELPVEKGAETIVWLATLPDNGPSGKFFQDKKEIALE